MSNLRCLRYEIVVYIIFNSKSWYWNVNDLYSFRNLVLV